MRCPEQATELIQLLKADQEEKQKVAEMFYSNSNSDVYQAVQAELKQNTKRRSKRLLQILNKVNKPSITNIGAEGAKAMSILALHSSLTVLKKVLEAFYSQYESNKNDTYYQAIPSMTDRLLILERKPQRFGTQWMVDKNKEQPFLPTVEDFEHVNERRYEFGIGPLRWPKSLAIPEYEQTWLEKPLAELVMRQPTTEELRYF